MDPLIYSRSLLLSHFPKLQVIFGGIIGADINYYNGVPGLSPQQELLNQVILETNANIHNNDIAAGAVHPYLTSKVHKWARGHCRTRYSLLEDGLHSGKVVLQNSASTIESLAQKVSLTFNGETTDCGPVNNA